MLVVVSGHLLAGLRLRSGAVEHGPPAPVAEQHQRAQQEEGEHLGRVVIRAWNEGYPKVPEA